LPDLGQYNILVEGLTDKMYLELAAERYREANGVDLLEGGGAGGGRAGHQAHGPDFGAQKNRHFFLLTRDDYRDKGGKSWDVEIEDMLPQSLVKTLCASIPTRSRSGSSGEK